MDVDQALDISERARGVHGGGPAGATSQADVMTALAVLADWVREHRPTMPAAQRGRTVAHAVRLTDVDGRPHVVAYCGGLKPDPAANLDGLDQFEPEADHACPACTRRLPDELRPPPPARPERMRPAPLNHVVVRSGTGPDVLLIDLSTDPATTVSMYDTYAALSKLNYDARQYLRNRINKT